MSRRAVIAVLQRERETGHRLTSSEVHDLLEDDVDISLAQCCAVLGALAKSGKVQRSRTKVRRRHRSPGAYTYALPDHASVQPEETQ